MNEIDWTAFMAALQHDPMQNIALLRHAILFKETARYFECVTGRDRIVHFPKDLSHHDRSNYPSAATVSILHTGHGLDELRNFCPPGEHIAKLAVIPGADWLTETLALFGLTTSRHITLPPDPACRIEQSTVLDPEAAPLFRLVGWSAADVADSLEHGGLVFSLYWNDQLASVCLYHPVYENIWELGALATRQDLQGKGLATRLVAHVINHGLDAGLKTRYNVVSTNQHSLAVAAKCGLQTFTTLRHYRFNV